MKFTNRTLAIILTIGIPLCLSMPSIIENGIHPYHREPDEGFFILLHGIFLGIAILAIIIYLLIIMIQLWTGEIKFEIDLSRRPKHELTEQEYKDFQDFKKGKDI